MEIIEPEAIDALLDVLQHLGYQTVGPTIREKVIVHDCLESASDLPISWTDEQEGGSCRLKRCSEGAYFAYSVHPQSWNRFLYPSPVTLWAVERLDRGFHIQYLPLASPNYDFFKLDE